MTSEPERARHARQLYRLIDGYMWALGDGVMDGEEDEGKVGR